jgi:hypothetical protein
MIYLHLNILSTEPMVWRAAITATITINFCFGQVCQLEFSQKTFFSKFKLPNSGCGLSISAAYTQVFTVIIINQTL